jgi:hypothetical protein
MTTTKKLDAQGRIIGTGGTVCCCGCDPDLILHGKACTLGLYGIAGDGSIAAALGLDLDGNPLTTAQDEESRAHQADLDGELRSYQEA